MSAPAAVVRLVRCSTAAQGLSEKVGELTVLERVAVLIEPVPGISQSHTSERRTAA